jgi:nucleotide-binding universal stress UspA family protein
MLARQWKARLLAVHAYRPDTLQAGGLLGDPAWRRPPDPSVEIERRIRRDLRTDDVDVHVVVREGDPADLILATIENEGIDLAVMAAEPGSTLGRPSTTIERVIRRSSASVLIVKTRPHIPYGHVLVGTDFTEESLQGLEYSAALFPDAVFALIHAYELPYKSLTLETALSRDFQNMEKETIRAFLRDANVPEELRPRIQAIVEHGPPELMLRRYVDERGADLTVIGALSRGAFFHLMMGGNTSRIVDIVPSDVLMVRAAPSN